MQVFYPAYLFHQNNLAFNLVQVIDDILLGTNQTVSRKLKFPAQFQQNTAQFLVGSLLEEQSFLMQDQIFRRVNQLLDIDSFLVEIFQLGNFYLIRRFMLESMVDAGLQVHDVSDGRTRYFLKRNLDVPYIAGLS